MTAGLLLKTICNWENIKRNMYKCSRCYLPKADSEYIGKHGEALKTCKRCRDSRSGANKQRTLDRQKGIVRVRESAKPQHNAEEIMGGNRKSLELLRVRW